VLPLRGECRCTTPPGLERVSHPHRSHRWGGTRQLSCRRRRGHSSVATAAPGDRDFNGGRWRVHALAVSDYEVAIAAVDLNGSGDIDSDAEVDAAIAAGLADDTGIVRSFECPLIAVPRR
jgi:hypothetical protein